MTLGERVKELRVKKGVTVLALADLIGVRQPFLTAVEKGYKMPSVEVLNALATELDCTTDFLLGR